MLNRRSIFNLGLWGSAGALLSWPTRSSPASASANTLRPSTTPFMDLLPSPPAPREIDWNPYQLPFSDLAAEVMPYVDSSQKKGKAAFYRVVAEVRSVKFHSQLPATEIWGYRDGHPGVTAWNYALGPTFRRPLANNSYSGTIVRHVNNLPSLRDHVGFGEPRNTVHFHGGHVPARSDGYPTDTTLPDGKPFKVTFERGEHFDYAYPLVDPGVLDDLRDGTNNQADRSERGSTLWYHDHILDFTSHNVYRGLAGFFLVRDSPVGASAELLKHVVDTGDETNDAGTPNALQLPSGAYDIPLVVQEKTFGLNGELIYDVFNLDGFMGEKYLVNGMVQPYLPVKRRKYRFRFLNGSNARIYQMFLADKNGRTFPMTQIATEGGLLARPVSRSSFLLSMAERVEVVIDFRAFKHPQFTELFIENRLVQVDGRGPKGTFEKPELAARGTQILKFVLEEEVADPSRVGVDRLRGDGYGLELRRFEPISTAELSRAPIRNFVFGRGNGQWQINGELAGDLSRVLATPTSGKGEIWRLINKSGGWWHPIHVHHEFMRVIRRNGKLPFDGTGIDLGQSLERDGLARKDTVLLGPNSEVEVFVKFRDFLGPYVFHCHNIEHEDHAMMARYDVI